MWTLLGDDESRDFDEMKTLFHKPLC
jgi:hypothetical protein